MLVESGQFNSLSPNIQIQIHKTDFCTFTQWISWENLFEDQSVFHEVIALYIVTTFSLDYVLISLGKKLIFISRRTFNPLKRVNSNEKYLALFSFLFPYQQYMYSGITVLATLENPQPYYMYHITCLSVKDQSHPIYM